MLDVASQDTNELVATDDQQLVQALPADRPSARRRHSRWAPAPGVQIISAPVERHTSSNTLVNLVSRSRIRTLHATA
jgi:hypothetical protein